MQLENSAGVAWPSPVGPFASRPLPMSGDEGPLADGDTLSMGEGCLHFESTLQLRRLDRAHPMALGVRISARVGLDHDALGHLGQDLASSARRQTA